METPPDTTKSTAADKPMAPADDGATADRGARSTDGNAPSLDHVAATTIGEAWVAVARRILADGVEARWGTEPIREVRRLTIAVARPDPDDPLVARYGDPAWLAWMRANFRERGQVAELGDTDSYGLRLRDWAGTGRDQIAWMANRLRRDPAARDVAITTFQPTTDISYVPCVSLLDAWAPDGRLELLVYAHSLDFGRKAYGNLVELAAIQREIAVAAGLPVGGLVLHVKTAHLYGPEMAAMAALVREIGRDEAAG